MTFHFGPQPVYASCLHWHVRVIHNGSRTFLEGEVFDNIQEQVLCLDCFKFLSESDVRAAWKGMRPAPGISNLEENL